MFNYFKNKAKQRREEKQRTEELLREILKSIQDIKEYITKPYELVLPS